MALFSNIEKTTRDAAMTHFGVMFAYKLFSLYFPLFLVSRGFSLPEVGYAYLLIYLPLALFSPIAGFLNHKINPAALASIGIAGYGIYALGMITVQNPFLFYLFQAMLGISAALFFVSIRVILISSPIKNYASSFGWFYSAPFYANALAPLAGALVIWKFGFHGVFSASLALQFLLAVFFFSRFRKQRLGYLDKSFDFGKFRANFQEVFNILKTRAILPFILVSFIVLIFDGFYRAFFVLFLKELGWSQNYILFFISVFSFLFLPLSLLIIGQFEKDEHKSENAIVKGSYVAAIFSIALGALAGFINFFTAFFFLLGKSAGVYIAESARSGLVARKLKEKSEEASALDAVFSPLGTAIGSLISGLLIGFLGYGLLFIFGGVVVGLAGILAGLKKNGS